MHAARSISIRALFAALTLLSVIALTAAVQQSDDGTEVDDIPEVPDTPTAPATDEVDAEDDQPRVILRVNRNLTVAGYVELDDDDVIAIRTTRGEVRSFPKSRVRQIIRLVDPQPGQRGVVYLNNGQSREGVILEDTFEHVLVEIEGIPAKLQRDHVDYVVLEPTFEQRYQRFRENLQPGMVEQHLQLCRWLVQHRRYELARQNLQEILAKQDSHDAQRLLNVVNAQLALQQQSKQDDADADNNDAADEPPKRVPAELLTLDEVNLIRVYEINFDNPPRLSVPTSTVRKLFDSYGTNELIPATQSERNAMVRSDPANLVRLMFELRARELYPEIQVNSEPHSLNEFRLRVHNTWLLNNCATSACHGGPDAGNLQLHRKRHGDERVRYTNFMILDQLEVDDEWPLINYEDPEMSLMIQYGLPRNAARLPHPDVRGWKPVFNRPDDRMFKGAVQWIKSMMQPRPPYPIEFDPMPRSIGGETDAEADQAPSDSPAR